MTIQDRITSYLGNGGLFNPEHMDATQVRDLLIDCRDEIKQLRDALQPFAHFADIWQQQMKGGNTAKTGGIYAVENRAGVAEITVEMLFEARAVLKEKP